MYEEGIVTQGEKSSGIYSEAQPVGSVDEVTWV